MKENRTTNNKGIVTNEKIMKLQKRLKENNLTRAEKHELTEELNWEKYRADPRPSMSLRKFKFMDGLIYLGDAFVFGFMGIMDNTKNGIDHKGFHAADIVMCVISALLIALVFVYLHKHSKYKIEPMDELANRNMNKAQHAAFLCLVGIVFVFALIKGLFNATDVTTIKNNTIIDLLAATLFTYDFFANMIFVYLEGKDVSANEEEDE